MNFFITYLFDVEGQNHAWQGKFFEKISHRLLAELILQHGNNRLADVSAIAID